MRIMESGQFPDPFNERPTVNVKRTMHLLGARFQFDSNSQALLGLADAAYAGLPDHRLPGEVPLLKVSLQLTSGKGMHTRREPPPLDMLSGAGMLGGATGSSNFAVLCPGERAALIAVSPSMLRFPYQTRYELIEFTVFTLAARAQALVPLHAACVGMGGRGILLLGPSGAGKSTVSLQCLLTGLDFLAEDSVFVAPQTMLATGTANFLHVRADSLAWFGKSAQAAVIRQSPVIRRRSGVKKFEVDLRQAPFRLAKAPLKLVAVVYLSEQQAGSKTLLRPLPTASIRHILQTDQAYAAAQPQWRIFSKNLSQIRTFELRRGRHPQEAVDALRKVLVSA